MTLIIIITLISLLRDDSINNNNNECGIQASASATASLATALAAAAVTRVLGGVTTPSRSRYQHGIVLLEQPTAAANANATANTTVLPVCGIRQGRSNIRGALCAVVNDEEEDSSRRLQETAWCHSLPLLDLIQIVAE